MLVQTLPPVLDTCAAAPLHADLSQRADNGEAIALDGAGVVRIGLACLQLLASARATAVARGIGFTLADPSPPLRDMASLARLDGIFDRVG